MINIERFFCALFILLTFFSSPGYSQNDHKSDKIKEFASVSGLNEMFDELQKQKELNAKDLADKLLSTLKNNYPKLLPKYEARAKKAYEKYILRINNNLLADKIREKYFDLIEPHFSEQDLDDLIEFYKSPIGKKSIEVTKQITPPWMKYSNNETNKAIEIALEPLNEEIDKIIEEYRIETESWWTKFIKSIKSFIF